ncbi:MAG: hypothetical protein ABIJ86_07290 [Spirochaetota bacterium]
MRRSSGRKIQTLVILVKKQSALLQEVGVTLATNMNETAAAINQIIKETGNLNAITQEITLGMEEMSEGSTATKIVGLNILSHDAISDILPGK